MEDNTDTPDKDRALEQLREIRDMGEVNMIDANNVFHIAQREGHHELINYAVLEGVFVERASGTMRLKPSAYFEKLLDLM